MPWLTLLTEEPRIEKGPPPSMSQHQNASRVTQKFDELVVTADSSTYDAVKNVFQFSKGVTAKYGVTTITCDSLVIDMGQERATAIGNVILTDPQASLTTKNLDFTWKEGARLGHADNVRLMVGHVIIEAESAELSETKWVFTNVSVTQCPEFYWIRSPRVVVVPGEKATMTKPEFHLFGHKIITGPNQSLNLNPRTQGVGLPSLTYGGGSRIGFGWNAGFLLDHQTNLFATANAGYGSYPGYGLVLTRSFVKKPGTNAIVTPASELNERFPFGYFDNVAINSPKDEVDRLQSDRNSVSIATLWNQSVNGRLNDDLSVSKPYELVYERGGKYGDLGLLGQFRFQRIYEVDRKSATRAVFGGTVELPTVQLAPNVQSLERIDMMQFFGSEHYGWVRGQVGATYQVNKAVRVGGALVGTFDFGKETFTFDTPVERTGANFRVDYNLGPTKISFLQKYDTRLNWYDREISFSQIAGCFEPYLIQRQLPQSFVLGVRLRTGDFDALIHRTTANRPVNEQSVISSSSNP